MVSPYYYSAKAVTYQASSLSRTVVPLTAARTSLVIDRRVILPLIAFSSDHDTMRPQHNPKRRGKNATKRPNVTPFPAPSHTGGLPPLKESARCPVKSHRAPLTSGQIPRGPRFCLIGPKPPSLSL